MKKTAMALAVLFTAAQLMTVPAAAAGRQTEQSGIRITVTDIAADEVANSRGYAGVALNGKEVGVYDRTGALTPYLFDIENGLLSDGVQVLRDSDSDSDGVLLCDFDGNPIKALSWESLFGDLVPEAFVHDHTIDEAVVTTDGYVIAATFFNDNDVDYGYHYVIADTSGRRLYDTALYNNYEPDDITLWVAFHMISIGGGRFAERMDTPFNYDFCGEITGIFDLEGNEWNTAEIGWKLRDRQCGDAISRMVAESDGLRATVTSEDGEEYRLVYLDENFDIALGVFPAWYSVKDGDETGSRSNRIYGFHDGYAVVSSVNAGILEGTIPLYADNDSIIVPPEQQDGFGYMDKSGRIVIPAEYDDAIGYGEGLFAVGQNDKYGYVDQNNEVVIPLEYEDVSLFIDGVAYGVKDGRLVIFEQAGAAQEVPGDLTGEGEVNASDAARILIAAARQGATGKWPLSAAAFQAADVNRDGEVNASDAALVLMYSAAVGTGFSGTITAYLEQR